MLKTKNSKLINLKAKLYGRSKYDGSFVGGVKMVKQDLLRCDNAHVVSNFSEYLTRQFKTISEIAGIKRDKTMAVTLMYIPNAKLPFL